MAIISNTFDVARDKVLSQLHPARIRYKNITGILGEDEDNKDFCFGLDLALPETGYRRLLVIRVDNVLYRFLYGSSDDATWYVPGGVDVNEFEGVWVFYSPAEVKGEIWEESTGNNRRSDYIRLAHRADLVRLGNSGLYSEIPTLSTERNLRLWILGQPLIDRKDGL
jgi:hypothetical protein